MNRLTGFIIGTLLLSAVCAAAQTEPVQSASKADAADNRAQESVPAAAAGKKKIYLQVGAIEKIENGKYVMRKIDTRYEFFLNDSARIFLRDEAANGDIKARDFIVVKGPKNKRVVLANSIYIYRDLSDYNDSTDKTDDSQDQSQKTFSANLQGVVNQTDPLNITLSDGRDYMVSYDADTYMIMTKKCDRTELRPGDRVKLYFDKLYSIRYDNYPVKVIIDRVKSGY